MLKTSQPNYLTSFIDSLDAQTLPENLQVGKGATATVYSARVNGQTFALKHYKTQFKARYNDEKRIFERLPEHPNIITLYGANELALCLVMQYAPKGTLSEYIRYTYPNNHKHPQACEQYTLGLAQGLAFLHKHGILHRDCKPSNVLIDELDQIKLCDFGHSVQLSPEQDVLTSHRATSHPYCPPEVITQDNSPTAHYTYGADIWTLGIVIWKLYTLEIPYKDCIKGNVYDEALLETKVLAGALPDHHLLSNETVRKLVVAMWDKDPKKRPSVEAFITEFQTLRRN